MITGHGTRARIPKACRVERKAASLDSWINCHVFDLRRSQTLRNQADLPGPWGLARSRRKHLYHYQVRYGLERTRMRLCKGAGGKITI